MSRIETYPADVVYEAAWGTKPRQSFPPPQWTNITTRVLGPWGTEHGSEYQLARTTAGTWRPALDNRDGGLDPSNPAGPYYPLIAPYNPVRIRMPFGVNQLTIDQATAGERAGLLNAIPARLNVVNDFGYPLSITTSGSAYQGTQVYQAVLPSGATQFATILLVKNAPVIPRQPYSFQAQVRITSGNSVSTNTAILWYDANGNSLGSTSGAVQTITSGSFTWVQLSASTSAAPSGAYSAQLKVEIASGTLTGSTTWQVDGLQWEQSAYPTPWTQPGSLGANLLPQPVATGTASIDPTKDSPANYFAPVAGSVAQAANLAVAPTGSTTAVAWTTPAGTTSSSPLYCGVVATGAPAINGPVADCVQTSAGQQYTASVYLMRASSADATVQVQCAIRWFTAAGGLSAATSGTAVTVPVGSWVRATITAFCPSGAVWGRPRIQISSPASTTATNVIYATGWQMEQAAAASTWVDPGPTYYAWSGYFEQFPQVWRLSGTWGQSDAVGTDVLAGLAQRTILDPFIEEVLLLSPNFFFPLNDPAGSTGCADATGKRIAAPIENSPFGPGSLALGSGITANTSGSAFQGGAGPVATFANTATQNPPSQTQFAETYIALHETTVTPGPPSSGAWTRMIAFRASTAPGTNNTYTLWDAEPPSWATNASLCSFAINNLGHLVLQWSDFSGASAWAYTGTANICDGNWHLLAIGNDPSGAGTVIWVDGAVVSTAAGATGSPSGIVSDVLGCAVSVGREWFDGGHNGDLAFAAEFPMLLTSTQMTNLYQSWRNASAGESSGARLARMLGWIKYPGPVAIDSGQTQSMGPASDLTGTSALDGFNAIITTENGDGFASNAGTLTFKSRAARYNSTPVFIFGEGAPIGHPGEWPAEDMQLPTDPINTYNAIPTQQFSTGQSALAQDSASQDANWARTLPTRVINASSFAEVQAAGQYLLGQLKTPRQRLASMTLNLTAVPGLWRAAAQLEKGVRIRAMKRPPYRSTSAPIQFDGFVERTQYTFDPKSGVTLHVEASPADLATYWVLAAVHTTLAAQATAGQNKATINALPDAATNALASSLPSGYQLTFDPGTALAETMTIAPGGIPSTSPGYSTAQLTFTANFQFTHSSGAVVCEPLPSGYSDPTTWDASSVLGVTYTTVVSGGASGTNTVTVGALPDAATNPLGSNWNGGDQITLSPGTANAETVTILSVATTLPGYTSCQITLTANLAHSHAAGDYVCDPLPAGVTSPTAIIAATRLSY